MSSTSLPEPEWYAGLPEASVLYLQAHENLAWSRRPHGPASLKLAANALKNETDPVVVAEMEKAAARWRDRADRAAADICALRREPVEGEVDLEQLAGGIRQALTRLDTGVETIAWANPSTWASLVLSTLIGPKGGLEYEGRYVDVVPTGSVPPDQVLISLVGAGYEDIYAPPVFLRHLPGASAIYAYGRVHGLDTVEAVNASIDVLAGHATAWVEDQLDEEHAASMWTTLDSARNTASRHGEALQLHAAGVGPGMSLDDRLAAMPEERILTGAWVTHWAFWTQLASPPDPQDINRTRVLADLARHHTARRQRASAELGQQLLRPHPRRLFGF
jgi:hypothetical protein